MAAGAPSGSKSARVVAPRTQSAIGLMVWIEPSWFSTISSDPSASRSSSALIGIRSDSAGSLSGRISTTSSATSLYADLPDGRNPGGGRGAPACWLGMLLSLFAADFTFDAPEKECVGWICLVVSVRTYRSRLSTQSRQFERRPGGLLQKCYRQVRPAG